VDIEQLREAIKKNLTERATKQADLDKARDDLKAVADGAEQRGEGNLNADEVKAHGEARARATNTQAELKALDEARSEMEQRVDDIEASEAARKAAEESAKRYGGTENTHIRMGAEEPVYRKDQRSQSFFGDLYAWRFHADIDAGDRLRRHQQMTATEARAVTTGGLGADGGLVIPQFLVEDFAAVARAGRPFANFVGSRPLPPEGMTLNVPRGNTGTIVGSQATQNTAATSQDYGVVDIQVPVVTIAGQQDMSRQSIDRGRNSDNEIMEDLASAYGTEQDRQVLDGSGSNGQHTGVLTTNDISTVTVSSTTASVQIRQVADAIQRVHSTRFMSPTIIVAHPRRWASWVGSEDGNGRPLVTPGSVAQNTFGTGDLVAPDGVVGQLFGVPVLLDANVPTSVSTGTAAGQTQTDVVIVTRASDYRLFEDSPVPNRVRFEETLAGQLTVKIVAWDYSGFTAGRYTTGTRILSGVGFTAPGFA